jgi:hypothetical protein
MVRRKDRPKKERQYMSHEERALHDRMAGLRQKAREARLRKAQREAKKTNDCLNHTERPA